MTIGLWFLLTVSFYFTNGVTNPSISGYMLIIVMASLLLGGRAGIWFAAATFVALTVLLWLELANLLPPFANDTPLLWQTLPHPKPLFLHFGDNASADQQKH